MSNWHKHQRPVGAMRAAALGVEERTPCATCHYPDCCCAQLAIEEDLAYITQGPGMFVPAEYAEDMKRALSGEGPTFAPRLAEWADIKVGAVTVFSCGPPCKVTAVTENEFRRLCPRTGQDVFGSKAAVQRGQYTLLAPAPEAFPPRTAVVEDFQAGAVVGRSRSAGGPLSSQGSFTVGARLSSSVWELLGPDPGFPYRATVGAIQEQFYILLAPAPEAFDPLTSLRADAISALDEPRTDRGVLCGYARCRCVGGTEVPPYPSICNGGTRTYSVDGVMVPEAFVPRIATREDIRPGARVRLDDVGHEGVIEGELTHNDVGDYCLCGVDREGDQMACYLSRVDGGAVTLLAPAPEPEAFVPRIATEEDMVQGAIVRDRCANYDEVVGYRDGDSWAASWADEDGVVDGCSIPLSAVRAGRLTLLAPAPGEPAPPPEGFKVSPERFKATTFDFGNGPVQAHKHTNGGGWVADTAKVSNTAYVGEHALVYDFALVCDNAAIGENARVYGHAVVCEDAAVTGLALVCGRARVQGKATVYGTADLCGDARVDGDTRVTRGVHFGAL